jgi:hypothetical protein
MGTPFLSSAVFITVHLKLDTIPSVRLKHRSNEYNQAFDIFFAVSGVRMMHASLRYQFI